MKNLSRNGFLPLITAVRWTYVFSLFYVFVVFSGVELIPIPEIVYQFNLSQTNRNLFLLLQTPISFVFIYFVVNKLLSRYPRTMPAFLFALQLVNIFMFLSVFVFQADFFRVEKAVPDCIKSRPCLEAAEFMIYSPFSGIVWWKVWGTWLFLSVVVTAFFRWLFRKKIRQINSLTTAFSLLFTGMIILPFVIYLYENTFKYQKTYLSVGRFFYLDYLY